MISTRSTGRCGCLSTVHCVCVCESQTFSFSCSHDGTDSPADAEDLIVVLNNFKSKIIKVKVSVKRACV